MISDVLAQLVWDIRDYLDKCSEIYSKDDPLTQRIEQLLVEADEIRQILDTPPSDKDIEGQTEAVTVEQPPHKSRKANSEFEVARDEGTREAWRTIVPLYTVDEIVPGYIKAAERLSRESDEIDQWLATSGNTEGLAELIRLETGTKSPN